MKPLAVTLLLRPVPGAVASPAILGGSLSLARDALQRIA